MCACSVCHRLVRITVESIQPNRFSILLQNTGGPPLKPKTLCQIFLHQFANAKPFLICTHCILNAMCVYITIYTESVLEYVDKSAILKAAGEKVIKLFIVGSPPPWRHRTLIWSSMFTDIDLVCIFIHTLLQCVWGPARVHWMKGIRFLELHQLFSRVWNIS